jgi:hypothetical protein
MGKLKANLSLVGTARTIPPDSLALYFTGVIEMSIPYQIQPDGPEHKHKGRVLSGKALVFFIEKV